MRLKERGLAAVLLIALILGLLWPALTGQKVLVAGDFLNGWSPWKAIHEESEDPYNVDLSDSILYYLPSRTYAADTIFKGHLPLWNPYILCGTPFEANGESGVFSILNGFFYFLRPSVAFGFTVALQLFLAGFFFYLLLRELEVRAPGAFFGAVVFMLNGFFIVWLEMLNLVGVALWIPLVILAVELWIKRRSPGTLALLVAVLALQFLVGFLQVSLYLLLAVFSYALFRAFHRPVRATLASAANIMGELVLITFLSAALAAIQLLPHVELVHRSHRTAVPIAWQWINLAYLRHLITFVVPNIFGSPVGNTYHGAPNYTELCGFVGITPLALAAFGLWRPANRISRYFIFLGLAALLIYLETPLNTLLSVVVPGYNLSIGATRIVCLITFALAALAGLGFDRLLPDWRSTSKWRIGLGIALLILTTGELLRFGSHHLTKVEERRVYPPLQAVDFLKKIPGPWRVVGTPGVLRPDSAMIYGLQDANGYESLFSRRYKEFMKVADPATEDDPSFHGVVLWHYDSKLLDLLNIRFVLSDHALDGPALTLRYAQEVLIYERTSVLPRAFVVHRYRVLHGDAAVLGALGADDFQPADEVILEEEPPLAPAPPNGKDWVMVTSYKPDSVTIGANLASAGLLILSDTFYPGWEVRVDGAPGKLLVGDYVIRCVALEAGHHKVSFTFRPRSFRLGRLISLATLAGLTIALGAWAWRRQSLPTA